MTDKQRHDLQQYAAELIQQGNREAAALLLLMNDTKHSASTH